MLCEALVDLVETNYYPIRASVTNRPPSVQSVVAREVASWQLFRIALGRSGAFGWKSLKVNVGIGIVRYR